MKQPSTEKWVEYFRDVGLPSNIIEEYEGYICKLEASNLPIIFEIEHLSKTLGINTETLYKMIFSSRKFYRKFKIKKKSGGLREIYSPHESLYQSQKWIYENILLKKPSSPSSHGFVPKKSIITNASKHIGNSTVLQMDIKNFFPSIKINWIINFFWKLGYSKKISFYLASLCCYDDYLAQGSPASPYLSNLLLNSLDHRLQKLSSCYQLTYTRYADDLTFSGEYIPYNFINIVSSIVEKYGLDINKEKTRLKIKTSQRIITGISVGRETISLPRNYKKDLCKELYFIEKYGYMSHVSKIKIKDPNYLISLIGKINFWRQVEPNNQKAQHYYNMLKPLLN